MSNKTERESQIESVMSMINGILEEFNMCIYAKEYNGKPIVCIRDGETNKDYVIYNNTGNSK